MREDFEPFENAEEVWFWFCASQLARGDGLRSRSNYCGKIRACETSDIQRIIKRMKLDHCISNRHLRVMFRWGCEMQPPYYQKNVKRSEIRLWEEAMSSFSVYLINKRILLGA